MTTLRFDKRKLRGSATRSASTAAKRKGQREVIEETGSTFRALTSQQGYRRAPAPNVKHADSQPE